jgi:hypothetical protein
MRQRNDALKLKSIDRSPMPQIDPYNPLELEALGGSLFRALESRPAEPLGRIERFAGSGIYALYYVGDQRPYSEVGRLNREHSCRLPIYVGRAKETGARSGISLFDPVNEPLLYDRVSEHKRSIQSVERDGGAHVPLRLEDFTVRTLVCLPLWVPLAEAMAIRLERPLWNSGLSGFGIHTPGSGRANQRRSQWDTLHAGRRFAKRLPENEDSVEALVDRVHVAALELVRVAEIRLSVPTR